VTNFPGNPRNLGNALFVEISALIQGASNVHPGISQSLPIPVWLIPVIEALL
jgi:hypothetical protein